MTDGLTRLGADVEAHPDGLVITGPTPLRGGDIDPRGDHRIALAFAIAGLISQDNVVVHGWSCVDTSFPEFLDVLARLQDKR
jgi:3-phosphoshikimate 1-carboxyvinyltransferase